MHFVERYTRAGSFAWLPPASGPEPVGCSLPDVPVPGDLTVRLIRRNVPGNGSCAGYAAFAEGLPLVEQIDPMRRVYEAFTIAGTVAAACPSEWRLSARSHNGTSAVIGAAAVPGALPPVVVTREIGPDCSGGTGCTDFFVAELDYAE